VKKNAFALEREKCLIVTMWCANETGANVVTFPPIAPRFPVKTQSVSGGVAYKWPKFNSEAERLSNFYACHPYMQNPFWPSEYELKELNERLEKKDIL
jgi:hypothetical protein